MKLSTNNAIALSLAAVLSTTEGATNSLRGGGGSSSQLSSRSLRVDNTRSIVYPDFRFVPWCTLDAKGRFQAETLSWTSDSWDVPGTGKNDKKSFQSIMEKSAKNNDTVADTMINMGWTESIYDCYINHYEDYEWEDLEEYTDTLPHWITLGWNSSKWNGEMDYPDTEDLEWEELDEDEKAAAIALCYFQELWDYVNISYWEEFGNGAVCDSLAVNGTMAPTADESFVGSIGVTMEESEMEESDAGAPAGAALSPVEADDTEKDEPEEAKKDEPEEAEEDEPEEAEEDKPEEAEEDDPEEAEEDKPANPSLNASAIIEEPIVPYVSNPANRFLLWSWLFEVSKAAATTLGYSEETWNQPMSATVESVVFDDLTQDQVEATYVLGLAPAEVWNCYINHYQGFSWDELLDAGVQAPYVTLGWSFDSWNALADPPASEEAKFEELTAEEQEAAQQLCYRAETWDKLDLNLWLV